MKKKIAIVGIQGVPNKYGGFETLVEFLIEYLHEDFEIVVYCSSREYKKKQRYYKKARLIYLPFSANGIQSIIYDSLSILISLKYDKILVLGSSGGILFPLLKPFKKKIVLNIGGQDWKRAKWSPLVQKFLKTSERLAILNSNCIISDNKGIQNYIKKEYKKESHLIEYGGDQVEKIEKSIWDLQEYEFLSFRYAFTVTRIQKDNNIELILSAFSNNVDLPIVIVGNWKSSNYGISLKHKYSSKENIILLDAIYDKRKLNLLRSNCEVYIHGHSAGGTNPSLVEAMFLSLPIFAYRSGFNENTTENKAIYFSNAEELNQQIRNRSNLNLSKIGESMLEIAKRRYQWKIITNKYKEHLIN